jgi:MFS family permease
MTQLQGTTDQRSRSNVTARIGVAVGCLSIAFSTLCFLVTPVFAGGFILAPLFGAVSGGISLALKAKRTAIVAFVFSLTPLCGFLLLQYVAERLQNGYVFFVPLGLALLIGALVLVSYSRAKRAVIRVRA